MTDKNEPFWRVLEFCSKEHQQLRKAANNALREGDAFAFSIYKAQQDAFKDVLDFMADVMHDDLPIL